MRYCQIYDFQQLGRITLRQYDMIMKSVQLQNEDKSQDMHLQAWLNHVVKNTKKQGKKEVPVFKSCDSFYKSKGKPKKKDKNQSEIRKLLLNANKKNPYRGFKSI